MASTITLSDTIAWAQAFLGFAPLTVGANSEPAISSANTILQTIVSPPFAWNWNRQTLQFVTVQGQQDYQEAVSNWGFIEKASASMAGLPTQIFEIEVKPILGEDNGLGRPQNISAQLDDDNGHISFRLMPVPDGAYTVTVTYQEAPTLITATSNTWAPIPDRYQFIYNWGFLALMQQFIPSSSSQMNRQLFVANLLAAAEGLEETEKNLFMAAWLGDSREMQASQLRTQQGNTARGL